MQTLASQHGALAGNRSLRACLRISSVVWVAMSKSLPAQTTGMRLALVGEDHSSPSFSRTPPHGA
jgi:hypothetical protein